MKTEELDYFLPPELIAQIPGNSRRQSRLLVLNRETGTIYDRTFTDLPEFLRPGDCLVLNNTRVLPARFFVRKPSGAQIEGLFLYENPDHSWEVLLKNARKLKPDHILQLLDRQLNPATTAFAEPSQVAGQWILRIQTSLSPFALLEQIGFAPLPPYIRRSHQDVHTAEDLERYQTVFAQEPGAVAAPTAGLHFDRFLLDKIISLGVKIACITLHVGIGTFRPVKSEILENHSMHEERFEVSAEAAETINSASRAGGRIIAVGTTSVRTLETIAKDHQILATSGTTAIFIRPGYKFQIVDAMITNFHLPKSTLLALAAAFAGLDTILNAYHHAIDRHYRFFSYGDAMLIL